jgi:uncharacterized membrane-anchored protein YhcB (DUF1043 family)
MSKEDIRELAEDNAIYEFNKFKKIYGNYTDEYVRHFYNKLAELRSEITDNHTCNCQHNSNSRENEFCCGCDNRQTNADRIRNMSDEELAEFNLCPHMVNWKKGNYDTCVHPNDKDACKKCMLDWLQSEAE